jgi:hypothetical protein
LTSYTTYSHRNNFLAPISSAVPAGVRDIGFVAGYNDASYPLWLPLGQRQVTDLGYDKRHFLEDQSEIEWVVVKEIFWPEISPIPLKTWAEAHHAEIVRSLPLVECVGWGPENWCLLHIRRVAAQNGSAAR